MSVSQRSDVTVNVDGLWMLQGLLDIRDVAPELRCRPYVATEGATEGAAEVAAGSMPGWSDHPGMAAMREAGVVVGETVHEQVAARMRVLAAPDVEVIALFSSGKLRYGVTDGGVTGGGEPPTARPIPGNELRVVLARRGQRWVSAVRVGSEITIDDVAITDAASIAGLVLEVLESIHPAEPAAITPVNVPMDEVAQATQAWDDSGFDVFSGGPLRQLGLSPATVVALGQALADPLAEASVYARQYRDGEQSPSTSVLSIKDGASGRLALYQQGRTAGSGEDWLAICPGTPQLVQQGVTTLLNSLPFGSWDSHRRI